ncbi:Protein FAR1-RELATED SEQUENCE [Arachis hypogaea]|nr:Protein FAR1-RELATED SEQUENCE [Arachis hypogaea]
MRFNEFNADYESTRGVPVMQTCIELLERYAAELYTHEIFLFFRPFLSRAGSMRVLNIDNTDDCIKYIVCKHGRPDFTWTVDFRQEEMIFMCTCLRMESFGIPCEHIVKVLVDRDIREIPRSLVLDRWTKKVKSALNDPSGFTRDAVVISRQSALVEFSKQLAAVAAKVPERYEETRDLIMGLYSSYKAADEGDNQPHSGVARSSNPYVHPTTGGSGQPSKKKKRQRCSVCQMEGHKKTTCPWQKDIDNNIMENEAIGSDDGDMCTEATAELDSDIDSGSIENQQCKRSGPSFITVRNKTAEKPLNRLRTGRVDRTGNRPQRNPSPPSSPPPFPVPQLRRRLQFLSTAASSSSPCPEPSKSTVLPPSVAWPSLVARRPAFPSSVRPPWLSLFCWLGATCCRIAARRRLPGSRRLPGRRSCLHRRFSVIKD